MLSIGISPARAQDWAAPARELADQLRQQIPPPARLAWSIQNRSTLSEDEFVAVRRAIVAELRSAGYRPGQPTRSVAQVRIAISENFQNSLWVAQIKREETTAVIMVAAPLGPAAPPHNASSLAISRKLLFSRDEPVLDLAMPSAPGQPPRLLVLGTSSIMRYELSGTAWQAGQTAPITPLRVWPRDARGRLALHADGTFDVGLPGERCSGPLDSFANLECRASDDPWPLAVSPSGVATATFVADRNYFRGLIAVPDQASLAVPDFYSAVPFDLGKEPAWLIAATDGQVRLFNARGEAAVFPDWGSELAVLKSPCGGAPVVLATRSGDFAEPDAVQAFQIHGRTAEAASAPVEFTGAVTVLRTSSEPGTALAVIHSAPTGQYEAYRLSIICSD